jgi:multiple sugar transport system permease protein
MKRLQLTPKQAENLAAYVFLTPWFVGLVLITAGPVLVSLYLAFTDYAILTAPNWVGMKNFVNMFIGDKRYWNSVQVTLQYVFFSVPMILVFALALAVFLNRGLRGLALYRSVFYVPSLIGASVAIAFLWRQIFGREGVLNVVLAWFGIQGKSWVGTPSTATWVLIILAVWTFGASMVIFLAALRQIPEELYEAASIDGAGAVKKFTYITLPQLTPVIFFNLILLIIRSFQTFTQASVVSLGTGGPLDRTLLYTLYLYQRAFVQMDMGYSAAMAWVLLTAVALFTAFLFWTAKYWVFYEN